MANSGFLKIGFIENKEEYPQRLKEKAGKSYYDYSEFNNYIEDQWEEKKVRCFNPELIEVEVDSHDIVFFMIETTLASKEDHKKLYGGFWSNKGPSDLSSSKWTGVEIGTEDELHSIFKKKINTLMKIPPKLQDWAFLPNEIIERLANEKDGLALREKWYYGEKPALDASTYDKYPILWNYLNNTFKKLWRDGKDKYVPCIKDYATFNTGLVDRKYDDIYALFEKNPKTEMQEWRLKDFVVPGEENNGKLINKLFNPLPPRADYFKSGIASVLYDKKTGQLSCDWTHIITEHCERYPIAFFTDNCPPGFTNIDGQEIDDIVQSEDTELQRKYFKELGEKIADDEKVFRILKNRVSDAIVLASKRVEWNYKTAVPMYYPTKNTNALLLPLAVVKDDVIDLALVVERFENGNYQGQTILALSMAYNNSRLITRPDSDWLSTEQIINKGDESVYDYEDEREK